MMAATITMK